MKIGVDAASLTSEVQAGNFQVTFSVLRTLAKLDKKNTYYLYSFSHIHKNILQELSSNFVNKVLFPQKFWMQGRVSLELLIHPVDIFLGFNQALPLVVRSKSIVFVLDLAFAYYPKLFNNAQKLSWQTKMACQKADKVIAISKFTKKDLIKLYKVNPSKIKVIYPGI